MKHYSKRLLQLLVLTGVLLPLVGAGCSTEPTSIPPIRMRKMSLKWGFNTNTDSTFAVDGIYPNVDSLTTGIGIKDSMSDDKKYFVLRGINQYEDPRDPLDQLPHQNKAYFIDLFLSSDTPIDSPRTFTLDGSSNRAYGFWGFGLPLPHYANGTQYHSKQLTLTISKLHFINGTNILDELHGTFSGYFEDTLQHHITINNGTFDMVK